MKVIDLLSKISKGEEVPKKIKYIDEILIYDNEINNYRHDEVIEFYTDKFIIDIGLNDEVEIIEEEQDIEELDTKKTTDFGAEYVKENRNKINELIKAVNELKNGSRKNI